MLSTRRIHTFTHSLFLVNITASVTVEHLQTSLSHAVNYTYSHIQTFTIPSEYHSKCHCRTPPDVLDVAFPCCQLHIFTHSLFLVNITASVIVEHLQTSLTSSSHAVNYTYSHIHTFTIPSEYHSTCHCRTPPDVLSGVFFRSRSVSLRIFVLSHYSR